MNELSCFPDCAKCLPRFPTWHALLAAGNVNPFSRCTSSQLSQLFDVTSCIAVEDNAKFHRMGVPAWSAEADE